MGKEILAITGSPRRKGNSDLLADALIRGAAEQGHTTHKFEAAYKKISGCRGCNMCWSLGTDPCVVKDDFYELVPLLETCEVAVFVSPVYFWGFTAQLKAAWDRFYSYCKPEGKKRLAVKESALLLTLGDTDDATWRHAAGTYKDISEYLGWKDRGIIAAGGLHGKMDILKHEALGKRRRWAALCKRVRCNQLQYSTAHSSGQARGQFCILPLQLSIPLCPV